MQNGTRNALLREEGPTVRVRVLPGAVVRARNDLAPSVPELFGPGQEIDNFDALEAIELASHGFVELVEAV